MITAEEARERTDKNILEKKASEEGLQNILDAIERNIENGSTYHEVTFSGYDKLKVAALQREDVQRELEKLGYSITHRKPSGEFMDSGSYTVSWEE
ncbi:hypothetical protein OIT44_03840 [Weissella ceti]|uniref:Phage protein n=1 Tax=Weissella ceti TaxID=759620 RepID=A0ABT3E457_9LACO|nr:hypothetical protein [Weissella ceti]MCW0953205.1 hypothetical protein [Weissella ceti]QVK12722.1 hypothetical protein KHQ31_03600 [Weissella ceti]